LGIDSELELFEVDGVTVGELNVEEIGEICEEPKLELESEGFRRCLIHAGLVVDRARKTI
jgi:hypothetical protein